MNPASDNPEAALKHALHELEGLDDVRERVAAQRVWLVGGAVRDLMLGKRRADLDLAVEGSAAAVASLLGADVRSHERFGTASVEMSGLRVDIASTRRERYPSPGALPEVEPASLADDLSRRDFTVNSMAVPLFGEPELVDPHGGRADLDEGRLRVLHAASFTDDPTRALRAARYAARLGFTLEERTAALLADADLSNVSRERVEAELGRTLRDEAAVEALTLMAAWGLAGVDPGAPARLVAARELLADPAWAELVERNDGLACALREPARPAGPVPARPSESRALVRGRTPAELFAERLAGADWLDRWAREWRHVELEIDGIDLMAAGVSEGPAIGRGLDAAHAAKLDGQISGRDEELRIALASAS